MKAVSSQNSTSPHLTQRGFTIVELIVTIFLAAIIAAAVAADFLSTVSNARDHDIISTAEEQANTLLNTMAFELRMTGSGMPLGQSDFEPGGAGLGTAPLAVLLTSDTNTVVFRTNETGEWAVLTADYTPAAASLTISLSNVSDVDVGDTIYISNMPTGGTDGLQGTVTSVGISTITISSAFVASAGAVFPAGSLLSRVTTITYDSPADGSGVTRNNEVSTQVLAPDSTFTIEYRDFAANVLTPPLTAASVRNSLAAVFLQITITSDDLLSDGTNYTATAEQVIALRNLNINR